MIRGRPLVGDRLAAVSALAGAIAGAVWGFNLVASGGLDPAMLFPARDAAEAEAPSTPTGATRVVVGLGVPPRTSAAAPAPSAADAVAEDVDETLAGGPDDASASDAAPPAAPDAIAPLPEAGLDGEHSQSDASADATDAGAGQPPDNGPDEKPAPDEPSASETASPW